VLGTLECHHFQSLPLRANVFPDWVVMRVESWSCQIFIILKRQVLITKSKAAIFCFPGVASCLVSTEEPLYLPTSKLSFTIRHVILSGSFCEAGLKKLETAFSVQSEHNLPTNTRRTTYELLSTAEVYASKGAERHLCLRLTCALEDSFSAPS